MSTKIDWTDETWNPVVGCSKVSPGCLNCYAERMGRRLAYMGNDNYKRVIEYVEEDLSGENVVNTPESWFEGWTGETVCIESKLTEPLHWRKPRKIFVCSMGDLFHESVPFEFIDKVFNIMMLCPQHTFQVLTKRPERMKEFFEKRPSNLWAGWTKRNGNIEQAWPFPNVWLGVTAENQEMADKRIPILLQTPAAKRFVSIEPMLGEIEIDFGDNMTDDEDSGVGCAPCDLGGIRHQHYVGELCNRSLDLVICGGESGPRARFMRLDWARMLRNECQDAGVPFFFKNIGGVRKPKDGHLLDGVEHRPEF